MAIVSVVGARPQFIKAAVVSRDLRKQHREILIHTGQHYDDNMSNIFFRELDIPHPDYNLGIFDKPHGRMTGEMLVAIEEILLKHNPEMLIVYGDTNSTLAGALAAVKLHVPVCHIEAGGRIGTKDNPEEVNRICADHVASLLMCCTDSSAEFLRHEGIISNVHVVGDTMYDAFLHYGAKVSGNSDYASLVGLGGHEMMTPTKYYYLTCHRPENSTSDAPLTEILSAMEALDAPTIFPVHPRNRERVLRISQRFMFRKVMPTEPVGYLTSLALVKNASKVVTDSGGLQREAFFAGVPCVTVFDRVIWPETMVGNQNQLAKPDRFDILSKLAVQAERHYGYYPFGDGKAGEKIVQLISEYLSGRML